MIFENKKEYFLWVASKASILCSNNMGRKLLFYVHLISCLPKNNFISYFAWMCRLYLILQRLTKQLIFLWFIYYVLSNKNMIDKMSWSSHATGNISIAMFAYRHMFCVGNVFVFFSYQNFIRKETASEMTIWNKIFAYLSMKTSLSLEIYIPQIPFARKIFFDKIWIFNRTVITKWIFQERIIGINCCGMIYEIKYFTYFVDQIIFYAFSLLTEIRHLRQNTTFFPFLPF